MTAHCAHPDSAMPFQPVIFEVATPVQRRQHCQHPKVFALMSACSKNSAQQIRYRPAVSEQKL